MKTDQRLHHHTQSLRSQAQLFQNSQHSLSMNKNITRLARHYNKQNSANLNDDLLNMVATHINILDITCLDAIFTYLGNKPNTVQSQIGIHWLANELIPRLISRVEQLNDNTFLIASMTRAIGRICRSHPHQLIALLQKKQYLNYTNSQMTKICIGLMFSGPVNIEEQLPVLNQRCLNMRHMNTPNCALHLTNVFMLLIDNRINYTTTHLEQLRYLWLELRKVPQFNVELAEKIIIGLRYHGFYNQLMLREDAANHTITQAILSPIYSSADRDIHRPIELFKSLAQIGLATPPSLTHILSNTLRKITQPNTFDSVMTRFYRKLDFICDRILQKPHHPSYTTAMEFTNAINAYFEHRIQHTNCSPKDINIICKMLSMRKYSDSPQHKAVTDAFMKRSDTILPKIRQLRGIIDYLNYRIKTIDTTDIESQNVYMSHASLYLMKLMTGAQTKEDLSRHIQFYHMIISGDHQTDTTTHHFLAKLKQQLHTSLFYIFFGTPELVENSQFIKLCQQWLQLGYIAPLEQQHDNTAATREFNMLISNQINERAHEIAQNNPPTDFAILLQANKTINNSENTIHYGKLLNEYYQFGKLSDYKPDFFHRSDSASHSGQTENHLGNSINEAKHSTSRTQLVLKGGH